MSVATAFRSFLLSAAVLALVSCGLGTHSPSEPGCADVAGSYDGTFRNSCGNTGSGTVLVTQLGCRFDAVIPYFGGGTVTGHIDGRYASFTLYFAAPCTGSATGTAVIGPRSIDGTFSGGAHGFGCCDPVSGSFSLLR